MNIECFAGMKPARDEVRTAGVRVSYYVWENDGPDVVLLHGITSSALTWWRVAPKVVEAGFRVTALDMPGHGDSDHRWKSYALQETAHVVDTFMASLEIREPIVVGHSWGGGVTLAHATDPATQIVPRAVVLLDPLIRMPPGDVSQYRDALLQLLGKPRRAYDELLEEAYPAWHECDRYWKAEALEKGSPVAVRGVFSDNPGLDLVPALFDLPCPWALIAADPESGGILPTTLWHEMRLAAEEAHGRMFEMPGVGHDLYREDFDGFASLLDAFLGSVTRPFGHRQPGACESDPEITPGSA